ncbi:hypothetical protein GCM10027277_52220 [Pseudoduganella ginsengisoli]|uniref:Filamentous hemagglutinin N-terminal domain-containing protein n=1 Tax=Pseudoduganella ginsengisoli TaxID=1462440 RepID=A0A6L6Q4S2_9BURK|nr:filamentous hemagglutinin N-terminal domain-containing protein [Pseudoduganella ginsengisoli]MTW04439.1 filamentous hemagglutinin N-terminal domain-containing protein [Pseudoduganella ginsengisoli]
MSARKPAASTSAAAAVLRFGRHRYSLIRRAPQRVATLLLRMMARLLGARAAWGHPAAALALLAGPLAQAAPPVNAPNALPTGASVVAGQASVAQAGNRMDITQQTGKAIVNWDTFNIGSNAAVNFRQPGADAVILNRVASNEPSQLLGSMTSNGKVWLVNPAGIMIGQGATLDLHGFVASTLAVHDADFLAGRMLFRASPQAGTVRNDGTIATPSGGSVYLVGADVHNHGVIRAPGGEVLLAAGASVELLDTATPGVRVAVTGTEGSAVNLGQIISTAGRIGMAGVLVKNSGVLNASSVVNEGGRIFLRATKQAVADGAAQLLATGSQGGQIEMTGGSVGVQGTALLDASGTAGGGAVLVGGDYQGGGTLPRAQTAWLAPDAVLRADAVERGNGGKIVLWSERATVAQGTVSARGGWYGGNGGMVETSGRQYLSIAGLRADTTAPHGKSGSLLLDPANILIGAVADADGTGTSVDGGALLVDPAATVVTLDAGTYSGATSKMTAGSIATLLATTSVSLAASNDITIESPITKTAGGDQTLTLTAGHDIALNNTVSSTSGKLGLNLTAASGAISAGTGSINLNGGVLTATAGGLLNVAGSGDVVLGSLKAGGNITIAAPGHVITFNGGTLESGGAQSYDGSLALSGNTTVNSGGAVDFLGAISTVGNPALAITNTGLTTFGGTVAVLDSLAVSGPVLLKGNVTTSGNQTYGGQLRIAGATKLTGTINSSRVALNGGGRGNDGGAPAQLTILAPNTTLSGTFDGFSRVNTGGATTAAALAMSSPWFHTSLLDLSVTGTVSVNGGLSLPLTGAVKLGADAVLALGSTVSESIGGAISGEGSVLKTGSGVTTFSQPGSYTGGTTVNGGTLKLAAANALGTGNLAIGELGTVSLAANTAIGGAFASSGTLSGSGTLTAGTYQLKGGVISANLGTGPLTHVSGSTQLTGAYGGASVSITGGTLTFGADNRLTGAPAVTVESAGTLDLSGFAQTVGALASAGAISAASGTLTAASYTLKGGTVTGTLAGGALTQTEGTVTLSGTYTGPSVELQGASKLTIGSGGLAAGSTLLKVGSGATVDVNDASAIATLQNSGTVNLAAALGLDSGASANAGVINISGAAGRLATVAGTALSNTAAGTVNLAGTNTAPVSGGGTFANAGHLNKTSAGTQSVLLSTNTGTVTVSNGALTMSGLAANGGTVFVADGATVGTASGALANSAGGTLSGSGTIAANVTNLGTIAPGGTGSIGTLAINGTLDTSAGAVNSELTSASSYDKVTATGAVTVSAATVINRTDVSGAYASGDVFDVLQSTASVVAGALPAVAGFAVENVSPSYHAVRLTSQAGDNFWIHQSGGAYASGAWNVAGNWSLGLPTAAQLVHIARADTLTVTLDGASGPASIKGLDLGKNNTLALANKAALTLGTRPSTLAGTIDIGSGSTLSHAGDLALAATGTLQGSGAIDVGTGTFTSSGKVSPGGTGIGTLQVTGNYQQNAAGTLVMDVGGNGAGQSDMLAVSGKALLDGALAATLASSYKPVAYQPIAIVNAGGGRTGVFSKVTLPADYQAGYGLAAGEAVRINQVASANYFTNSTGTLSWDDKDNWSKGKAPVIADDVVIDTGLGLAAGAGKQAMSTLRIVSGAALDINGSQFDVKKGMVVDGALRISGDTSAVTLNALSGTGTLALGGGTLSVTGAAPAVGTLAINGGAMDVTKAALVAGVYTQGGGKLSADAASTMTVTSAYSQTGGALSGFSTLDITQGTGTLTLGNVTVDAINAKAVAGDIAQSSSTALVVKQLQVNAPGNVALVQANTVGSLQGSAGGALSVQGVAAVGTALAAGGDISLAGSSLAINAGITSSGGNVTLQADEVDVYGGSKVASAGGAANFIKVNSLTAAQPIKFSSLGGEDTGAGLLLNTRDMAAFTTPTLVVGDAGHTGAMSLTDGGGISAPGVSGTLRLVNNGAFSRAGTETITANGLDITATGGIVLDGANHVASFAAANSGSGNITFTNNSGLASLALGTLNNPAGAITIDNTGGIAASSPGGIAAAGKVALTAHSPVAINTAVTSGSGIQVTASTDITLGAAARLTTTAPGTIALLAQNGSIVLNAASRIDSAGGSATLEARGAGGAVVAPAGAVIGSVSIASTELDNAAAAEAAAQAAADAAAKAAAEAAAKAAADQAAAEAAAKAAADAAAKKAAAEAAAKAAAEKAAAEAAAKAAADKAAAEAAAKAAADKAAADAAAKAAAEAAAKAAADAAAKAAADAAAKAAADQAAAEAAAKAAAEKAAAEAAAKAAADKAAADAAAKAAAEKAAAEAAAKAAAEAAAKAAADQAAAEAVARAAAEKAAADAAAQAAAEKAAADAAVKAAADAAAKAAAKAAADEAARQAADNAAKAAANSAKQPPQQPQTQPQIQPQTQQAPQQASAQDGKPHDKPQDSKGPDGKPSTPAGNAQDSGQASGAPQDSPSSANPAIQSSSPASAALAQAFEQQTIGGGADSFGGSEGSPGGDHGKDGKGKEDGKAAAGDGKDKKAAKKMSVCR